MYSLLLAIIYLAFISLGLPDALLGAAWPSMYLQFGVPVSYAGAVSMIIAAGTVISSLMSDRLTRRLGAGRVTAFSVLMTAAALFGFSVSRSFWVLCCWAVPYGIGAGCVDAALNNFVALHYKSRHMSWLHCFWGVGATAGPMILSLQLSHGASWRSAYGLISGIQFALALALFLTLSVWRHAKAPAAESGEEQRYLTNREALRLPLVKTALVGFVFFCAVETTSGLWASTYLHQARGLSASEAAMGASMFYGAITLGRLITGFAASRISPARLIRIGQCVCLAGAAMVALPAPSAVGMLGIAVIGLGTSPIYPNMLHETPRRFGARNSQAIVGLEMAFAYIGSTLIPPLFGSLASATTLHLYPWFLAACTLVMLAASETVARRTRDRAV